jgi:hypothetical protein
MLELFYRSFHYQQMQKLEVGPSTTVGELKGARSIPGSEIFLISHGTYPIHGSRTGITSRKLLVHTGMIVDRELVNDKSGSSFEHKIKCLTIRVARATFPRPLQPDTATLADLAVETHSTLQLLWNERSKYVEWLFFF